MYTLEVTNNFIWPITASDQTIIAAGGGTHTFNSLGNVILNLEGIGAITFIDLGDTKLDGYPEVTQTWGVLVRAHTTEAYYRYEGGGFLIATIDAYGSCTLSTSNGTLIPISLEEMDIKISGI